MTTETKSPEQIAKELAAPFAGADIEWRIGQSGTRKGREGTEVWAKVLAYVTNRAIMHRLDAVLGIQGWKVSFRPWHTIKESPSQICSLSLLIGGEWITKEDGADCTDIESVKGGLSDAMKRAAVQFGVGRYLYDLDEGWATTRLDRPERGDVQWRFARTNEKGKDSVAFYWQPPALPEWALPLKESDATTHEVAPQKAMADMTMTEMNQRMDEKRAASVAFADKMAARTAQVDSFADLATAEKYVCDQYDAGKLHDFDKRRVLLAILDRRIAICETETEIEEAESQFLSLRSRKQMLDAQAEEFGRRLEAKRARLIEEAPL